MSGEAAMTGQRSFLSRADLLGVVVILMLRPQGLSVAKVRR